MGNFNRGNKRPGSGFNRGFGNNRSSGYGNRFEGRDDNRPVMHKATCGECGQNCEIPFRPTGDRPVFCSDCFKNQGGSSSSNRSNNFGDGRRERSRFDEKQMHDAVCAKCGNDCQVPFRPMTDKPVFCSDCFEKGGTGSKGSGEIMEQIKMLNTKLDKLMQMLTPVDSGEKNKKNETKKEIITEEIAKTKIVSKKVSPKKKKEKA